jgi:hypothetical protein
MSGPHWTSEEPMNNCIFDVKYGRQLITNIPTQDRRCTYNVTLRSFGVSTVAVENQ